MREAPQRSCIACRKTCNKDELMRYVLSPDGQVIADIKGKLPGRGAYTCPTADCLRKAVARRQFGRAFHQEPGLVDPQQLIESVRHRLADAVAGTLSLANKAGKAVSGTDAVLAALKVGGVGILVVATDCSADTVERLKWAAKRTGVDVISFFTRDQLASLLGKEQRVAVAIRECGFVVALRSGIDRYRNFLEGGALDEQNPGS
jgi:predicted RNA-binding protein YlxR (DUF448 family)/ribosomal protein L30E